MGGALRSVRNRRRLLPQPHGFEGLGPLLVETPPDDASVTKGHDLHASRRNLYAVPTPHARSVRHHDVVADIDELVRSDGDPVERVDEGAPEASARVVAAIDARFDTTGARPIALSFGSDIPHRAVQVAIVEGSDCPANDLHL